MSMNNLTIDGEFRYIVQWFNEWSELQRDDFVPILEKYITGSHMNDDDDDEVETIRTPVNMNGLPNDVEFNGRPMSLFQCRIKLFNQWNRRWPTEFKEKLQQKITEIDGKVGEKISLALNSRNIGSLTNGYASKQDRYNLEEAKLDVVNCVPEVETMVLNDPMTEVLNNETSVDDIETNEAINNRSVEQPLLNNTLHSDDNDDAADDNDNKTLNNNTRHNHAFSEHEEPVEQVVQMQNLNINEENAETERDHEDVKATMEQEQQHQQPLPVTVNPVIVTPTITTNAEVPLVV